MFFQNIKNKINTDGFHLVYFCLLILFITSCSTKKYLKEDDFYLRKNKIIFQGDNKLKKDPLIQLDIDNLIKQKPNKRFLWVNKRWYYYHQKGIPSKWLKEKMTEEPAIYNERFANETAESIKNYLFKKSFFNAKVEAEDVVNERNKTVDVHYYITPGKSFTLDTLIVESEDTTILPMVHSVLKKSSFKKNAPISSVLFEQTKYDIYNYLQDNGYATFSLQNINLLDADTSHQINKVKLSITAPLDSSPVYIKYKIGDIRIYPDFQNFNYLNSYDTVAYGLEFIHQTQLSTVDYYTLRKNIYFSKNDIFNKSFIEKTAQRLNNINIYKFANLRPKVNQTSQTIDYQILLKTLPVQQFEVSPEIYLGNNSISEFQVGTHLTFNYTLRNLFKKADLINGIIEGGAELNNLKDNGIIGSPSYNARFLLQYTNPNFNDYFYLWKGLKNLSFFHKLL